MNDYRPVAPVPDGVELEVAARDTADPELVLGPATKLLWRSPAQVHLELGTGAVVVEGLPLDVVRQVAAPRTSGQSRAGPPATGSGDPAPPTQHLTPQARHALLSLRSAGYLWDRPHDPDDDRFRPPRPTLRGEFGSLAVRNGPDAAQVLRVLGSCAVEVHGTSRVAEHLAAVLASAGVGRVRCVASGDVRLSHAVPGGLLPSDEGSIRSRAAADAVHRAAPDVDSSFAPDQRVDLTLIAMDSPVPVERRDALHAAGSPHLLVRLGVDHGVVGPLVVPGLTSCLRCADLVRTDRDPAWNALAAQLATPSRYGPMSGVALATTMTGVAAVQALAFLDGDEPATVDGTLEMHLPDWRLRRRSWPVHPACDCVSAAGPG